MILPKTTLAAILVKQKKELVIDEIQIPKSLDVGQVLLKYFYSGICGSQIGEIDGVKGPDRWLPHLLGHEASAQVLSVGPGVSRVNPGDFVVGHWKPSGGIEGKPPKYNWKGKVVNAGFITTFNEFGIASENRLTKISKYENLKTAALYGCAVTTGFGLVVNKLSSTLGKNVVVFGAGGIGLSIIQALKIAGANEIIAVDLYESKLRLAKKCGATITINSKKINAWEMLNKRFKKVNLDVFIDNTGNTEVMARGYEILSKTGELIFVGVPSFKNKLKINTLPLHFGKCISGTHGGETNPELDIPRYMTLLKNKKIDLEEIVTKTDVLKNINHVIENIKNGKIAGRAILKFS